MKLVIIDDHPLVRQGIAALTQLQGDMELVGEAGSSEDGLGVLANRQPDVALVDLKIPGEYGLDIIKRGRKVAPGCRFIVLTSCCEQADFRRAMTEKVEGYVLKEALPEELINAIRLVTRGRTYIDPALIQNFMAKDEKEPLEQLTTRETEVLGLLSKGMSNREIAAALFITEYTVKKHISNILDKLELTDRTQAALFAYQQGLI